MASPAMGARATFVGTYDGFCRRSTAFRNGAAKGSRSFIRYPGGNHHVGGFYEHSGSGTVLFLLSLALWLGLTTAFSTMMRSAFSYSCVLAGYTVAIIALPALSNPLGVFDQAVARCTEISLGIMCATLVSALLWPSRVEVALTNQAREASKYGVQAAQASLVGGDTARNDLLELLSRIIAVDAQREHAWFEGHSGRQRARAIGALVQSLLMMLRLCRSVRRQWQQLDDVQAHAWHPGWKRSGRLCRPLTKQRLKH